MEKPQVLLIDDDQDFSNAIKASFEKEGYSVAAAYDGEEGVRLAKKMTPDLVVLDVMMPKKDGYSVCHDIKSDDATSSIPVIMLTSLGSEADGKTGAEILAKGHKANAYFDKPVDTVILVNKAKELIEEAGEMNIPKVKALLIDDDPDFIAGVKLVLEEYEFEVSVAYTGEEGLSTVLSEKPDVVLCDVILPEKDGFSVCKEIKENESTAGIPVLMLTSVGEKMTEGEYAKAVAVTHRADDYIEKPVEPKELLKRIRKFVGPKRRLV